MISETVKKLNIENNSHKFKNTVCMRNGCSTFDAGKDCKTLSVRWVSPFEEHTSKGYNIPERRLK